MPLLFNTPARFLRTLAAPALLLAAGLCGTAASAADDAAQMALGKKLFTTSTPACAVCHTLKDAGAEGAVGPVLDELRPDAARVTKALRDGLGSMPSFKASLTDAQIAALALYVATASRQP
ncbi:sulfide dehydrogenase [Rhodococcus sp. SRB_17]|uniref:SorU family sulfite dehydrogenase c-type cytochrome subunit n=1 Tax=Acidovorax sp. SRB_24 TaxID=1962700 RepID=UPI00145EC441|nr:sulfide dehydrogenase [Acidovorax sp. SRB_24]NMM90068.1 sulfide dehydrogenase [Rhodococcus sp. SRB_17]